MKWLNCPRWLRKLPAQHQKPSLYALKQRSKALLQPLPRQYQAPKLWQKFPCLVGSSPGWVKLPQPKKKHLKAPLNAKPAAAASVAAVATKVGSVPVTNAANVALPSAQVLNAQLPAMSVIAVSSNSVRHSNA